MSSPTIDDEPPTHKTQLSHLMFHLQPVRGHLLFIGLFFLFLKLQIKMSDNM